jgi:hypothetical protein
MGLKTIVGFLFTWPALAVAVVGIVAIVALAHCCSSRKPAISADAWKDIFAAGREGAEIYTQERVDQDLRALLPMNDEGEVLCGDMLALKQRLLYRETAFFTQDDLAQVELLLHRILNARETLSGISEFYRDAAGETPEVQARGGMLGLISGAGYHGVSSFLLSEFAEYPDLRKLLNNPCRRYGIPENTFEQLLDETTSPDTIRRLRMVAELAQRAKPREDLPLKKVLEEEPEYAALWNRGERIFSETWVRIHYTLMATDRMLPELGNMLRHSDLGRTADVLMSGMGNKAYALRGLVFTNVSRLKRYDNTLALFSRDQKREVFENLEPGDVILTYTSGYMSNVFLPGLFKHGIIYFGPAEERHRADLNDDFLSAFAISKGQLDSLRQRIATPTTIEGHRADIIEAVSEGVKYSSLEDIMDTHVTRLLALRPNITAEERRWQLAETLAQIGAPYDFRFDFSDATHLCCTELVYRTLHGKGPVDLSFTQVHGHWVLNADDIAKYALENRDVLSVVLLAEADLNSPDHRAVLRFAEAGRDRLGELFSEME